MSSIRGEIRQALRDRERYIESRGRLEEPIAVRAEIAASWQRSLASMVDPNKSQPDFQRLGDTQLSIAAFPIIDHYLQTLDGTHTSLLFAEAGGRLIGRWTHDAALRSALSGSFVEAGFTMAEAVVGTNGVGTVFEAGKAVAIAGPEHYSDQYLPFACFGAPIRHPMTRRMIGAIDITCRVEDASPLAMPWISGLAQHIERQLLDQTSGRERALLNAYLVTERRSRLAVACLNGQILISNPAASALLSEGDQEYVWEYLQRSNFRNTSDFSAVDFPDGRVMMLRSRAVRVDGSVVGAVIEVFEPLDTAIGLPMSHSPSKPHLDGLVGVSDRWINLCEQALQWPRGSGGIVVTGEPGTGKLAVLKAAFSDSTALTVVDCSLVAVDGPREWLAALRSRLQDNDGVVVLRHVEMLDASVAQAICSILDMIEDPPRMAATVVSGGAGEPYSPLLDRFEVHRVEVPPLRQRTEDFALLVNAISSQLAPGDIGPRWLAAAVSMIAEHPWPDNVRGLTAVIRRVLHMHPHGVIAPADLPDDFVERPEAKRTMTQLERLERQEIIETLNVVGGNKALAAKKLNFARSTLYRKMNTLGIRQASLAPHLRR
nr:helix-turn-helix domain-containing protein [Rhodococcus sp. (in: high G+C Gram-positive bacteria)]